MKHAMLLACLLASGLTLSGQTAASSVAGQVVNATTGGPVRRATVSLRLSRGLAVAAGQSAAVSGANTVETDDQGRFAFRGLAPGAYQVDAQRQGFLNSSRGQSNQAGQGVMLGDNQQLTGVVLRLTPHSVISGKVLDAQGDPAMGAQVAALQWGYVNGQRQLTRTGGGASFTVNDLGEYRISGLASGSYIVMATPPRGGMAYASPDQPLPEKPDLVKATTYYPGATDAAGAAPVRVAAGGETRGIDIKLGEVRAARIRGRVIDSGTRSNNPASVSLRPRNGGDAAMLSGPLLSSSSGSGSFLIAGVLPGSYYLVARRSDGQEVAGGVLPIEVADKNLDGITIQVARAVDVQGAITSDPPGRCAGYYVSLAEEGGNFFSQGTSVSNDPKLIFKSVIPGTYTLTIPSGGGCYVKSIRFGGREAAGMKVKIDGSGTLEIALAAANTTVEGAVTDSAGRPLAGATVTFLPVDGVRSEYRTATTSRTGGFSTIGLRPGAYDVFAWESVDYAAAQSPEYLKQFESQGKSLAIEAGGRQTIQLTAIPASATGTQPPLAAVSGAKGSIEGRVIHAVTGAPIGGVTVTLGTRQVVSLPSGAVPKPGYQGQASPPDSTVETDAQGNFAFRGIQPEIYYISAQAQGLKSTGASDRPNLIGEPVIVGDGQRIAGFTIKLAPQSVVAGKVTDEFGEPVANAQVALYHPEYIGGVRRLPRSGTSQTDDLGKFRISSLAPGSYYLGVTKRVLAPRSPLRRQPQADGPEMGYGMVWYPSAPDVAGASPVVVGGGVEVPVDIVLRRTKAVRVRGMALDADGNPMQRSGPVFLTPRGLGTITSMGSAMLGRDGTFEIASVPAGSYMLSASATDGVPIRKAFLPVDVRDSNIDGIRLQYSSGREVRGAMKLDGGGAWSGFVSLSAPEGVPTSSSTVNPNGTFVLRAIWPLTYGLTLPNLCENCYLKSVRYAGREVPEGAIDFSEDGELEILLSASAASLDGVAVDGQGRPAADATVMLASADVPGLVISGKSGGGGNFHFGGLRPGAYRAYAWEGAAPDATPEALAPFQGQANTVRLAESAREKVQIATIKR
jgi:protocatechuate 3,4-dioxygenase beta subunit